MPSGGVELERLYSTVGVDLTELRSGLASAQSETAKATAGMSGSFDKAASGIDAASKKIATSTGNSGVAQQILQATIRKTSDQFAAGAPLATIFAEHIESLAEAAEYAGGAMGKFGEVMAGPWGIAAGLALSVGTALISSMFEQGKAADGAKAATDDLAEAEKRLADAMATANHATRQGIIDDINRTVSQRNLEIQTRKTLSAQLEAARADQQGANAKPQVGGMGVTVGNPSAGAGAAREAQLNKQLADNQKKIDDANKSILSGAGQLTRRDVAARNDPKTAADQRYADAEDKLTRQFESGSFKTRAAYDAALDRATKAHEAELKSIKDAASEPRRAAAAARKAAAEKAKEEREAAAAATKAYDEQRAYQKADASAENAVANAKAALTGSYEDRAQAERDANKMEHDNTAEQIVANRDYSAAQKATLLALNDQLLSMRNGKVDIDEQRAAQKAAADKTAAANDVADLRAGTQRDLLSQEYAQAKTARDRQTIALQIVQADHDLAEARQKEIIASNERVLASNAATDAEKAAAQAAIDKANATLDGLDKKLPGEQKAAKDQNPSYFDPKTVEKGFGDTLHDGIVAALTNKNIKDTLKNGLINYLNNATSEAVSDLMKAGGKLLKGLLGNVLPSLFGGARAVGGPVLGGRAYNVGSGEKFVPSANGRVLSRQDAMDALGAQSGSRGGFHVSVDKSKYFDVEVQRVSTGVTQSGIAQYDGTIGQRVDDYDRRRM